MTAEFDAHSNDYGDKIERSIKFAGAEHDFFVREKARALKRIFAEHFGDAPIRVLDVGCGHGLIAPLMVSPELQLTGCDLAGEPLKIARESCPAATFDDQPDPDTLPYGDDSFDVAYAICVVHHVAPGNWDAFVAEMRRVVRPGGLVVIVEHNPLNPLTQVVVKTCELDENAVLVWPRVARSLMTKSGLSPQKLRYVLFTPFQGRFFRGLDDRLGSVPLGAQYLLSGIKE